MRVQVAFIGKVINELGEVKGEENVWLGGSYLVEQVGKVTVGRRGRKSHAGSAVAEKITSKPEVPVFRGKWSG